MKRQLIIIFLVMVLGLFGAALPAAGCAVKVSSRIEFYSLAIPSGARFYHAGPFEVLCPK